MTSLLIVNTGGIVTGDLDTPRRSVTSTYVEDGLVAELDSRRSNADTIVDARGLLVTPGLIDTHVHPTFGDFTPTQNSIGWMRAYLHGGVTRRAIVEIDMAGDDDHRYSRGGVEGIT